MSGISDRNPYVGPRPIQQGEALYGRTTEVGELYHLLQARRVVVLHSPSGAGKSSLVQAGLIPRLKESKFDVWKPIRVNLDPRGLAGVPAGTNRYLLSAMVSLEEELPADHRRAPAELARVEFPTYLSSRPRRKGSVDRSVVLLFDQFEKVLTVAPRAVDEKRAFFDAVGQALDGGDHWALFIIREDYLAAFAPYRDRVPTQMANTFRLDLLGLDGAREAAEQPALRAGRTFPGVDQLIHDLSTVQAQQPDGSFVAEQGLHVEPVQLQVVCRRLWDAMPEDDLSIDPEDIARYADVTRSLADYYADAVAHVAGDDPGRARAVREWVGTRLIVGGIRSQVRQEAGQSAGLANSLIDQLVGKYVVRTEQRAGSTWYELSHDRLVGPVQKDNEAWEQAHLHPLQVQARSWEAARRSEAMLLAPGALAEADAWAKANPALVTDGEKEFLEASRKARARARAARRSLYVFLGVASAAAIGMLALAVWALGQKREALEQKREAERVSIAARNGRLVALAQTRKEEDPAEAMALLRESSSTNFRMWLQAADDLVRTAVVHVLHSDPEVSFLAFTTDGASIVYEALSEIRIAKLDGSGSPGALIGKGWNRSFALSPDGKFVVSGPRSYPPDQGIRFWNLDVAGSPRVLQVPDEVTAIAFSPDGKFFASNSLHGSLRVWNADGTGSARQLGVHDGLVSAVAFSPDGKSVVSASDDKTVRIWNADGTGSPRVLHRHEGTVTAVALSRDGRSIAFGSEGGAVTIYVEGAGPRELYKWHRGQVTSVAFSPDGKSIVSGSDDKSVRIWNVDEFGRALHGSQGAVSAVAFSPDGKSIASASADRTIRIWSLDGFGAARVQVDGRLLAAALRKERFSVATFGPDRRSIAGAVGHSLRVWKADGSGSPRQLEGPCGDPSAGFNIDLNAVAFSPDGRSIVAGSFGTLCIWSADGPGPPRVLVGPKAFVNAVAFSPDSKDVVSGWSDGSVRIWNVGSGSHREISGQKDRGYVNAVAFSPDGKYIVSDSSDRSLFIWNVDGSGSPRELRGNKDRVRRVAFSPDGRYVVSGSSGGSVRIWSADGSGSSREFRGEGSVNAVAFSPDGGHIVSGSSDSSVRIWNADGSGSARVLQGENASVTAVAFSPDGKSILSVSSDSSVRIWTVDGDALRDLFWTATPYCLPVARRQALLDETPEEAKARHEECRARVARAASGGRP